MRFIHTGDIHLGATPESDKSWASDRGEEIWATFERLIKRIKIDPVDLLLIAGDLFNRQPLLKELKEVNYLFSTIPNTKVVIIAGNHDYIKTGSFYNEFKWEDNVTFILDDEIKRVDLDELNVTVYGMSYHTREIRDALLDRVRPVDDSRINILLGHGGDEKHIPINKRLMSISGFDYIAMGHIHKPEVDEYNKFGYCGALEPIDKGDIGNRGYIYGEMTKDRLDVELVPFAKRTYKVIKYELDEDITNLKLRHDIEAIIEERGVDDMYRIVIKGFRDPDFTVDKIALMDVGNIVDIKDKSEPDYDFDQLMIDNKDNILGMFIREFSVDEKDKKALYYGTKALMDAVEEKR